MIITKKFYDDECKTHLECFINQKGKAVVQCKEEHEEYGTLVTFYLPELVQLIDELIELRTQLQESAQ